METALSDRHRVGVEDFILLENYTSDAAFVDNLRKRFQENLIYTYIGQVLISVNPYKNLPIYTTDIVRKYRQDGFVRLSPHLFAVADTAYRSLTEEHRGQCILISGESGSGKTEASKKVLHFIAAATGHQKKVENVKDKLLKSNPVLEAFGNAKTNKNDNSSRFGKYMDISFDFVGDPVGGNILSYLLEKSRVVYQNPGERNFHIFYQLLSGAGEDLLNSLHLDESLDSYSYLNNSGPAREDRSADASQFQEVKKALSVMEIPEKERDDIFKIVATILHIGNVTFTEENDKSSVLNEEPLQFISELLGCERNLLKKALTNRTIEARGDVVVSPLNKDMAIYARDALAKAVYDRLFSWLVNRLNNSLQSDEPTNQSTVMGILDIYGFEVFKRNSFEQFCINYCNEKLQQLFIHLTLKEEQEEYHREGIEWVNVEFYDNKIICNLIEEKHKGIIAMMDEECLRPGEPTDMSFLAKMNNNLNVHQNYVSHINSDTKTQKTLGRDEFRLRHYAGDVTYNVKGFLDKNNDLLFRDLCEVMTNTSNLITKTTFTEAELNSKKRPNTAVTKFKNSLNELMDILVTKEPSYIRCIKPNDFKAPNQFDEDVVKHQVKYLGLMENLRVRRAGFAYRRPYEDFLHRYKCLSKKTWPNYSGSCKDGVGVLVKDLGYEANDYRMGKTKLFIRSPNTLFETEDAFQLKKHDIATMIQKIWRGRKQRLEYEKTRKYIIAMQTIVRGFLARRRKERLRNAYLTITRFVKGYVTRYGPETDINKAFVRATRVQWLMRLSKELPMSVLSKYWPSCPESCKEASEQLQRMRLLQLARTYCLSITPEEKKKFEEKVLAEFLFRSKKKSYPASIAKWFIRDRLHEDQKQMLETFKSTQLNGEKILYSTSATKYDRHGYKPRNRALLVSDKNVYLLDAKTFKMKHKLAHSSISEIVVTSEMDNFLMVRIPPELKKDKGDLLLSLPNVIEAVTLFLGITNRPKILKVVPVGQVPHTVFKGKPGVIKITSGTAGSIPGLEKSKKGELVILG